MIPHKNYLQPKSIQNFPNQMKPNRENIMGNYHSDAVVMSFISPYLTDLQRYKREQIMNIESSSIQNAWQFNFTAKANSIKTSTERRIQEKSPF